MSDTILHAAGVHKTYRLGNAEIRVLRGASLSVARGEFLAVTGASGSGKSTLLHLLGALDVPDRGQVVFDGLNLFAGSAAERDHLRNVHFGFVFQFYHLLPELNTLENVLLPAMSSAGSGGRGAGRGRRRATCWEGSAWAIACATAPASCPAGNASGWPSLGPWSTNPKSCSPMSQPVIWTPRRVRGASVCSSPSTTKGRLSSW